MQSSNFIIDNKTQSPISGLSRSKALKKFIGQKEGVITPMDKIAITYTPSPGSFFEKLDTVVGEAGGFAELHPYFTSAVAAGTLGAGALAVKAMKPKNSSQVKQAALGLGSMASMLGKAKAAVMPAAEGLMKATKQIGVGKSLAGAAGTYGAIGAGIGAIKKDENGNRGGLGGALKGGLIGAAGGAALNVGGTMAAAKLTGSANPYAGMMGKAQGMLGKAKGMLGGGAPSPVSGASMTGPHF